MPFLANTRHTLGLVLASVGGLTAVLGLVCFAAWVWAAVNDGKAAAGLIGCSAVAGLLGGFLLWRGIVMRKRAIASGSTLHVDGDTWGLGSGLPSTRSGTKRPSFLKDNDLDPNRPPGTGH